MCKEIRWILDWPYEDEASSCSLHVIQGHCEVSFTSPSAVGFVKLASEGENRRRHTRLDDLSCYERLGGGGFHTTVLCHHERPCVCLCVPDL